MWNYRQWRWRFGGGCYVSDVDQLEWRAANGQMFPVALLELSRVDGNVRLPWTYLKAVLDRFTKRDGQGSVALKTAGFLKVPAFIVLFRWDLSEFWVFNLVTGGSWNNMTRNEYAVWLRKL